MQMMHRQVDGELELAAGQAKAQGVRMTRMGNIRARDRCPPPHHSPEAVAPSACEASASESGGDGRRLASVSLPLRQRPGSPG